MSIHSYNIQDKYLFPVVHSVYTQQKEALIAALLEEPVTLVGDGRCDSPGFSAKYGTYNIMEISVGAVVTFSLQQVTSDTSSVGLETSGCFDALKELKDHGIDINIFGTDCSRAIGKLLKGSFPEITHDYDVYHIEKRIKKMLIKKANKRENYALRDWIKPVLNHLWWAAQNCNSDPIELREKWISAIYHVTDQHEWPHFDVYHTCAHPPLTQRERRKKKWLKPDSSEHQALKQVVMDQVLVQDIQRLTHAVHTGGLEVFHSLGTKYCPKRQYFSYKGMLIRSELAVLDHNNNLNRTQAATADGQPRYTHVYPKRTKTWIAKPMREGKSHKWRLQLVKEIRRFQQGERSAQTVPVPEDLPPNIADDPRPPKEELIANQQSRFANPSINLS